MLLFWKIHVNKRRSDRGKQLYEAIFIKLKVIWSSNRKNYQLETKLNNRITTSPKSEKNIL
jgi:hypothetical protein